MAFLKYRLSGVLTIEAGFVVSIILLILMYHISFTLGLYGRTKTFGEKCVANAKNTGRYIESMRLTRFAFKAVPKGE